MKRHRDIDTKILESYPDNFDIIKVNTLDGSGSIEPFQVFKVLTIGGDSEFGELSANGTYVADKHYELDTGDKIAILGWQRNYAAILVLSDEQAFPNDTTSIIVGGEGKNLSKLNGLLAGVQLLGKFERIQLAANDSNTVLVAYR